MKHTCFFCSKRTTNMKYHKKYICKKWVQISSDVLLYEILITTRYHLLIKTLKNSIYLKEYLQKNEEKSSIVLEYKLGRLFSFYNPAPLQYYVFQYKSVFVLQSFIPESGLRCYIVTYFKYKKKNMFVYHAYHMSDHLFESNPYYATFKLIIDRLIKLH